MSANLLPTGISFLKEVGKRDMRMSNFGEHVK